MYTVLVNSATMLDSPGLHFNGKKKKKKKKKEECFKKHVRPTLNPIFARYHTGK